MLEDRISTTIYTPPKGKLLKKFDKLKGACFPKWRWENAHKSSFISMFLSTLSFLHLLQFIISVLVIPNAFEESLAECDNSRTDILGVSVAILYIGKKNIHPTLLWKEFRLSFNFLI